MATLNHPKNSSQEVKKEEEKQPEKEKEPVIDSGYTESVHHTQTMDSSRSQEQKMETVSMDSLNDSSQRSRNQKISNVKEEGKEENPNENTPQTISYTVLLPDNKVLYHKQVTCDKPMTVIDFLLQTGINIDRKENFIQSINGISNQGMSGWVFEVNNAPVMVPASEYIMNPNEQITWKYVDFSKMAQPEETHTTTTAKGK